MHDTKASTPGSSVTAAKYGTQRRYKEVEAKITNRQSEADQLNWQLRCQPEIEDRRQQDARQLARHPLQCNNMHRC